jgi:hypothetical protein
VGKCRVGEQSNFVVLFIRTAAQKGSRTKWMVRGAPVDDLHAKYIPIEFRRRNRVCGVQSNVVDTGLTTGSLVCHFVLCYGLFLNVSHFDSPLILVSFVRSL